MSDQRGQSQRDPSNSQEVERLREKLREIVDVIDSARDDFQQAAVLARTIAEEGSRV